MPAVQLEVPHLLMAQKLTDKSSNDLDSNDSQTSILVLLSARAIGSLGFAVSLLAIWFGWLLPASFTTSAPSDISEIKKPRPAHKHHHRRSASSSTGAAPPSTQVRRSSIPVDLAPILVPHPEETLHDSTRRVSFAETPLSPVVRRNTLPPPKSKNLLASSLHAIPPRPSSSSSSSPSPSRPGMPPSSLDHLNAQVPDAFSRHSCLNKLKLGFNLKTNRQLPVDKQSDGDSITSIESTVSEKITKQSSGGFVAAWSNSRASTVGDVEGFASPSRLSFVRMLSPGTPSTAATFIPSSPGLPDIQSPTYSSRKSDRRRSTPIPRTHPYGAPYFASPPVLLDKNLNSYPNYLKALPQFDNEFEFSSARASAERGREPVVGKDSLYPGRRVIPKRRSASEDWTVRSPTEPRPL